MDSGVVPTSSSDPSAGPVLLGLREVKRDRRKRGCKLCLLLGSSRKIMTSCLPNLEQSETEGAVFITSNL